MDKVIIGSYQDFEKYIGKEIGTSDYLEITQEMINMFADATLDHQWIHTDPERAAVESPFKKTIAHGYLTIAVAPHLWHQIADVQNIKMMINYGIEKLKFGDAVTVLVIKKPFSPNGFFIMRYTSIHFIFSGRSL